MNNQDEKLIIRDRFELLKFMVNDLEKNLPSFSFEEQLEYLDPIRNFLFEAVVDVKQKIETKKIDNLISKAFKNDY